VKSYFPDVNVWLAVAYQAHEHHPHALRWLDQVDDGMVHFCRFTQIGFLRLITHPSVMRDDVRNQRQAWEAYDLLVQDERVSFLPEPDAERLDSVFRRLTSAERSATKQWPDAYLAAFARAADLTLVTFDRALQRMAGNNALLLG
jgi:toxin-antitoxin system PIN domain toxin